MRALAVLFAALVALAGREAGAQEHVHGCDTCVDSAAASFIARARVATARYRDRSIAIADGYHRVGPELPAMGEHWLNIAFILADTLDAAHPPVLIYVSSPKGPVLAGLAYTRLLGRGDRYPDFPRGLHAWHDHSGFVEDEALPMTHVGHSASADDARTRLGILHLWTEVANPAGEWTADNWALPFVRAGLRRSGESEMAARAVALAVDSGRYYLDVFTSVGRLDSGEVERVGAVLVAAGGEVRKITGPNAGDLGSEKAHSLELLWRGLWPAVARVISGEAAARVEELRTLWW
jgi:hypothetical protein